MKKKKEKKNKKRRGNPETIPTVLITSFHRSNPLSLSLSLSFGLFFFFIFYFLLSPCIPCPSLLSLGIMEEKERKVTPPYKKEKKPRPCYMFIYTYIVHT